MTKFLNEALFRCLYGTAYLVSLLPMRFLYGISSVVYFFLFIIFSYRRLVVTQNISRSFSDKKYDEIKLITKKFYQSFIDNFVELLKTMSISSDELDKKITFINFEIAEEQLKQGRNVIACIGHCGNWEMLNALPDRMPFEVCAVYKPIRVKFLDKMMYTLRSRFGVILVPAKSIVRRMLSQENNPAMYLFLADQCPREVDQKYRFLFLNQTTSMFSGPEKLARATNSAVIYIHILETLRGEYSMECSLICAESKYTEETEIIQHYNRLLEQNIIAQPFAWLWTHKRWKR